MAATAEPTLHEALYIARRLSPRDRAQLISFLARELAEPIATTHIAAPQATDAPAEDPWDVLDRIGKELGEQGRLRSNIEVPASTLPPHISIGDEAWDRLFRVMDEISALPRTGPLSPMEDLTQGRR